RAERREIGPPVAIEIGRDGRRVYVKRYSGSELEEWASERRRPVQMPAWGQGQFRIHTRAIGIGERVQRGDRARRRHLEDGAVPGAAADASAVEVSVGALHQPR